MSNIDWMNEARKQASAAGMLKIYIAEQIAWSKEEIDKIKQQIKDENCHISASILVGRLIAHGRYLEKMEGWLNEIEKKERT